MCNMFTQYSLPVSYNAETRFKDGSMPIIVSDSSFYTTVTVSAPELAGLWEMYPIPERKMKKETLITTRL